MPQLTDILPDLVHFK